MAMTLPDAAVQRAAEACFHSGVGKACVSCLRVYEASGAQELAEALRTT